MNYKGYKNLIIAPLITPMGLNKKKREKRVCVRVDCDNNNCVVKIIRFKGGGLVLITVLFVGIRVLRLVFYAR